MRPTELGKMGALAERVTVLDGRCPVTNRAASPHRRRRERRARGGVRLDTSLCPGARCRAPGAPRSHPLRAHVWRHATAACGAILGACSSPVQSSPSQRRKPHAPGLRARDTASRFLRPPLASHRCADAHSHEAASAPRL
jgi:hypothetical protein